jgi:hypothetical protein
MMSFGRGGGQCSCCAGMTGRRRRGSLGQAAQGGAQASDELDVVAAAGRREAELR